MRHPHRPPGDFDLVRAGRRIVLRGDCDLATAPQLEEAIGLLAGSAGDIVVDLGAVDVLSAAAVFVLSAAERRFADDSRLVIVNPTSTARLVLELMRAVDLIGVDVEVDDGGW